MTSGLSESSAGPHGTAVNAAAKAFEDAWEAAVVAGSPPPDLGERVPGGDARAAILVELAVIDLGRRLAHGHPAWVNQYLERFPELRDDPEAVRRLIATEYRDRLKQNPGLGAGEYAARYAAYDGPELVAALERARPSLEPSAPSPSELAALPTGPDLGAAPAAVPAAVAVPGYEILGVLGRGGMGVVYKARHARLSRVVALKMIRSGWGAGPADFDRFRAEALAAARVRHPNVVQIFEVGDCDGCPYMALELVSGGSLAGRLNGRPLPPRQAAEILEQVARGVQAVHRENVVHRDLKPANVLIDVGDGRWQPKVADFGLAKLLDADGAATRPGAVLGTAAYMAPEQARGEGHAAGPAADVYALGAILYELLTGGPPFRGTAWDEVLEKVRSHEPAPPTRARPDVPRDLETICLKCLQKEPRARYASAEALADDLRRFQEGRPVEARPVGRLGRLARWGRRNPGLARAGAAVLVLLAALTALLPLTLHFRDRARQEADNRTALRSAIVTKEEQDERAKRARDRDREQERAGREFVSNGVALLQAEDRAGALLWFAEALRADHEDRDREQVHRMRLTALFGQCARPWRTLAHPGGATVARLSPDGRRLATAGKDGRARLWDVETGVPLPVALSQGGEVRWLAFSASGGRLLTAGPSGVRLWAVPSGQAVAAIRPAAPVSRARLSADGSRVLTVLEDQSVVLWDADTGQALARPREKGRGPIDTVLADFSADGKKFLVAGVFVRVWDSGKAVPLTPELEVDSLVVHAEFSPDGSRVLAVTGMPETSGFHGDILVWEGAVRKLRLPPDGQQPPLFVGPRKQALFDGAHFTPDGEHVVAYGWDGVELWHVATGRRVTPAAGAAAGLPAATQLLVSRGGRMLFQVGRDCEAWDVCRGALIAPERLQPTEVAWADTHDLFGAEPLPWRVARVPERVAPAPGVAPWWHPGPRDGVRRRPLAPDLDLRPAALSEDGRRLLALRAGEARVLDSLTAEPLTGALPHEAAEAPSFTPDGRRVLTVSAGAAWLWDVARSGAEPATFPHDDSVRDIAGNANGSRLLTLTRQYSARLWDRATGRAVGSPVSLADPVKKPAVADPAGPGQFAPLILEANDPVERMRRLGLNVWEQTDRPGLGPGQQFGGRVGFTPDGKRAVLLGRRSLHLLDAAGGEPVRLDGFPDAPADLALSRDRRQLAVVTAQRAGNGPVQSSDVRVWDLQEGRTQGTPLRRDGAVQILGADDGARRWLLANPQGHEFLVWEPGSGAVFSAARGGGGANWLGSIELSGDGNRVLTAETRMPGEPPPPGPGDSLPPGGSRLKVWDVVPTEKGRGPVFSADLDGGARQARLSPDGQYVLAVSGEPLAVGRPLATLSLRVWNVATGQQALHPQPVDWADFAPELGGRTIVTFRGTQAQLWSAATGRPLSPPLQHQDYVASAAFSADGRLLALTSNRRAQVWDAASGQLVTPPLPHPFALAGCAFTPDGNRLLVAVTDRTVRVWDLTPDAGEVDELVRRARAVSGRKVGARGTLEPLTAEEFAAALPSGPGARPDPPARDWHEREARAALGVGEWGAATWHLDRVLSADPGGWQAWAWRGQARAGLGDWAGAARDFARAAQSPKAPPRVWYYLALLRLYLGDEAGYRAACGALWKKFAGAAPPRPGMGGDFGRAQLLVRTCVLGPKALDDPAAAVDHLRRASVPREFPPHGAALYRAGQLQEAWEALGRSQLPPDLFFLSMARHALGDRAGAAGALADAERQARAYLGSDGAPRDAERAPYWHQELELRLLRREAQLLVRGRADEPPP